MLFLQSILVFIDSLVLLTPNEFPFKGYLWLNFRQYYPLRWLKQITAKQITIVLGLGKSLATRIRNDDKHLCEIAAMQSAMG